jgi:Tol biopolymer transport system component
MSRSLPLLLMLIVAGTASADVIDVRQGTNLSVAVYPAKDMIVVDLLGGLWRLPVAGGGATALIPSGSGIAQPRFDPSGERIVFQRWLDGQWDIWQLTLANGQYAPLTETPFNEREPEYSPDGRRVVFAGNGGGEYQIWSLDLETKALRQLTDEPGDKRFPTFSAAGILAYVHRVGARSMLKLLGSATQATTLVSSERRLEAPSWRPGGGVLVYNERVEGASSDLALYIDADEPVKRRLTQGEDVFTSRVAWLSPAEYVYAADGQLWRRKIASTERTPIHLFAGAAVDTVSAEPITKALDAKGPHRVVGINGLVRHEPSGRTAFSALGDLWLLDDGKLVRLTDDAATDAWPDFSPAGEWLIFASDRGGDMEIWRMRLSSGQLLQLSSGSGRAFLPRVSPDGQYVAFLKTAGYGPWDAASLELTDVDEPFRSRTLATGLYDARDLVWQGSRLRLLARDEAGKDALARVLETPVENAAEEPQSNRPKAPLPGTAELSWTPAAADAPYVIQAGRMFNGVGDDYIYLVDIHVEGQRITDIVRRGQLPLPERVIDARDMTIVPGLIDVHAHQSTVAGSELGRLWLSHGVTTVREVMADPHAAVERAETWASGQQPGPRLVISPASPAPDLLIPAGSPVMLGTGARVAPGLSHGLAEQMARDDEALPDLPPVLAPGTAPVTPELSLSPLGRSYQDVIGELNASGAWLPTELAALGVADRGLGIGSGTMTIERVMRSTGRVAIGTDAPAVPYGAGFHEELALLAEQGIPNAQILRWATAGGAIALGLSLQLGTLEPGRLADLLVVDGDPLADIQALDHIEAIVKGGVWMDRSDLSGEDRDRP